MRRFSHLTVAATRALAGFAAIGGLYAWAMTEPDLSWWVAAPAIVASALIGLLSVRSIRRAGRRDRAEIRRAAERERAAIRAAGRREVAEMLRLHGLRGTWHDTDGDRR